MSNKAVTVIFFVAFKSGILYANIRGPCRDNTMFTILHLLKLGNLLRFRNKGVGFHFFFHFHYSPLWALACRTTSFHFFLSATNSLHLLTPSTWRSLSTSSFHLFLGLLLLLVPSSSWVKIFSCILSSSIFSRWPNQLILCPFIHFTIFYPLLISSSSRFVRLFHSSFSYLGSYILLNSFVGFH